MQLYILQEPSEWNLYSEPSSGCFSDLKLNDTKLVMGMKNNENPVGFFAVLPSRQKKDTADVISFSISDKEPCPSVILSQFLDVAEPWAKEHQFRNLSISSREKYPDDNRLSSLFKIRGYKNQLYREQHFICFEPYHSFGFKSSSECSVLRWTQVKTEDLHSITQREEQESQSYSNYYRPLSGELDFHAFVSFALFQNGIFCGWFLCKQLSGNSVTIQHLWIYPEYRALRSVRSFVYQCVDILEREGISIYFANVLEQNLRAFSLFSRIHPVKKHFRIRFWEKSL
jgi:hypothetical protein